MLSGRADNHVRSFYIKKYYFLIAVYLLDKKFYFAVLLVKNQKSPMSRAFLNNNDHYLSY